MDLIDLIGFERGGGVEVVVAGDIAEETFGGFIRWRKGSVGEEENGEEEESSGEEEWPEVSEKGEETWSKEEEGEES